MGRYKDLLAHHEKLNSYCTRYPSHDRHVATAWHSLLLRQVPDT